MSALTITNLETRAGTFALTVPNLKINEGEISCVMGRSGTGKSTLLNAIAGFVPSTGSVRFNDRELQALPPESRRISIVFQRGALFPNYTVAGNVEFGLRVQHLPAAERAIRVKEWLTRMDIASLHDRFPSQISEGQAQRVAMARAMAVEFPVLLLDEPFAALDRITKLQLRGLLRNLVSEKKLCCLLVTHDLEEATSLTNSLTLLADHTVAWQGPASELPANYEF